MKREKKKVLTKGWAVWIIFLMVPPLLLPSG
jgi:ferric iron reductase protein FhuF